MNYGIDQMNTAIAATKNEKLARTLSELASRYNHSNLADGKSPKTVKWYDEILRLFCMYVKAKPQSEDISLFNIDLVRDYILYLRHKPKFQGHPYTPEQGQLLSPKTVQCHVRALKAFSSWLYVEGHTKDNKLKNLKLPKAPTKVIQPLTPEEIKKVVVRIKRSSSTGWRNYAILVTLLDTGLRVSEIAGIPLGQVNFEGGYITVMGKGAKERIVPIGKFVQMRLLQYCEGVRPKLGNNDCDSLFLSCRGKPITTNTIKLIFSRLAKSSGIDRLHAHLCRHTFAINYLLNGGDIFSLQEILGHTTLEMVRHYLRFTSSQITARQHEYSPMDRLYIRRKKTKTSEAITLPVTNDISTFSNSGGPSEYLHKSSKQVVCHR